LMIARFALLQVKPRAFGNANAALGLDPGSPAGVRLFAHPPSDVT
jgi:hypothetical protein